MTASTQNEKPGGNEGTATRGKTSKASYSSNGACNNGSAVKQPSMPGAHVPLEPAALANGRAVLRSAMEFGFVGPLNIPVEAFHPELQSSARVIKSARDDGACDFSEIILHLIQTTEPGESQDLARAMLADIGDGMAHHPTALEKSAQIVREYSTAKKSQYLIWELDTPDGQEPPRRAEIIRQLAELEAGGSSKSLLSQLESRAFDFDHPPPKPVPLFQLCGMALCTPGNLMNIQALPKAGKSAVVESMIAAIFNGNRQGSDTLGFSAENPKGFALIHFDTEQSRFDHDSLVRRAVRRSGILRTPGWFISYSVADLDIRDRRLALRYAMQEARDTHGGIFSVLIDGIGDLCGDPNDSEESFDLVHELHALAITHDCSVITVLHENPGSESGKTRGHLGSQLERKAETNLRLAKDANGTTTMWAERARHCYLPKEQGPCFSWNGQAAMHTSCGTAGEIKSAANRERFENDAAKAFGDAEAFRHADLVEAVTAVFDLKERAAKDRVRKWTIEGVIQKDALGKYRLTTP